MKFKVTIVSAKEKWEIEADSLTLPSQEGQLTILCDHAPIMGKLKEGQIIAPSYKKEIKGGFFEIIDNQARILINEE
ncbi:MAG: hypothetical protein JSW40_00215 [Candidatus Omnitrophota bacterium]|nr:MAG: hypothetical protein JSW40_00215 [Candidatus Omnitrophota bacterium]